MASNESNESEESAQPVSDVGPRFQRFHRFKSSKGFVFIPGERVEVFSEATPAIGADMGIVGGVISDVVYDPFLHSVLAFVRVDHMFAWEVRVSIDALLPIDRLTPVERLIYGV